MLQPDFGINMKVGDYDSVIFDCDGVILQSNAIKSEAFAETLEGENPNIIIDFVSLHKRTGGVSRYNKLEYFYRNMVNNKNWQEEAEKAVFRYGEIVKSKLTECDYIPGFLDLLEHLKNKDLSLSVNTGGAETEVCEVFTTRGITKYFKKIYGSPITKKQNMVRLLEDGLLTNNSLYIGDSLLDFQLSQEFKMNFTFVKYESEWSDGVEQTELHNGLVVSDLSGIPR